VLVSPVIVKKKETWAIEKKYGHMEVQEKNKKDSHALKRIYRERSYKRKEFPFHPP